MWLVCEQGVKEEEKMERCVHKQRNRLYLRAPILTDSAAAAAIQVFSLRDGD